MIKIVGDVPQITRLITEMPSFDLAFSNRKGNIGFPIGTATEISGAPSVGKSTTVYGLAGLIAHDVGQDISLADFEGFDPIFLEQVLKNSNFDGTLHYIQDEDDETSLDRLLSDLREKKLGYSVGILDSIGAISPLAEAEGDLGEANMGRRAKLLAAFSRKMMKVQRDSSTPKTLFLINHLHPIMGGRGFQTPGGETVKYLCALRVRMKRKEEFPDGSYVIEGKVIKNRYGYKDLVFHLVILSGTGIHKGLTWMYDGFLNGSVKRDKWIKIGDKSICRLKEAFEKAHAGDEEFFMPFHDAVYNNDPDGLYVISGQAETDAEEIENVESSDGNSEN